MIVIYYMKYWMNEWMNVFILTSDKPQMKLQRMDTKCHSLHNKNYSLQYDLLCLTSDEHLTSSYSLLVYTMLHDNDIKIKLLLNE